MKMSDEIKKQAEEAVGALRTATEEIKKREDSNGQGVSELKAIVEKTNAALDKLEEKNSELVSKQAAQAKKEEEFKEQMKELEEKTIKLGRTSGAGKDEKAIRAEREMKALTIFAQQKSPDFSEFSDAEQKSYLRSDSNVDGGFLMEESFDDMILKPITEMSAIRPLCRTKRINALSEKFALRSSLCTASWEGEGEAAANTNSTYSQPEIHVHKLDVSTKITMEALLGSRFNMDNEILSDFAETRGQKEGAAYVVGTGVKQPRGFMDDTAGVPEYNSGDAATYDFDALINLTGQLKTGYNPVYGMNRKELAFMRTLQDGGGQYIWQAGNIGASVPNQVNGYNYVILPDMEDKGANAHPVIFADFMKMYTIVDAFQAVFLRNQYLTGADRGKVEMSMMSWTGGDVTIKEAGVRLKCAV